MKLLFIDQCRIIALPHPPHWLRHTTSCLDTCSVSECPNTASSWGSRTLMSYLNGTEQHCITYNSGELDISAFVISFVPGDVMDLNSMTGISLKLWNAV